MELYQLKTFVAIAQEGNLTRAAERVFTSAPAVSAQLKALEDELGVKLFDRTPRGMTLTMSGEQLLVEAQRTLTSAMRIRSAAEQIRGAAQGVVRFGTVVDPVALRLGEALVKLAERHPQVSLQLRQGLSYETLDAVQRGDLDCAYSLCESEAIEGLELIRLGAVDLVVALPPALAQAHTDLTLADLTLLPWVGTPSSCVLRTHTDRLFAVAGHNYQMSQAADSESNVRSMIASGLGVGIIRHDQAAQAERQGEVVVWNGWRSHTWLCWIGPKEGKRSIPVDAVRAVVLEAWH